MATGSQQATLDAIVVGAGITGLTAAFRLVEGGARVALLEASDRPGGVIESRRDGGWLFELGPNTVLDSHPEVGALLAAAGLDGERLTAGAAGKRRWIRRGGRLIPLPTGPGGLIATPLLSARAKLRLLREPWVRRRPGDDDESIAGFVSRRLGPEVLDAAVGPFVSGVWAGDPERLSVRWTLGRLAELESRHGSLVRGMLAAGREARRARREKGETAGEKTGWVGDEGGSARRGKKRRGAMLSFPEGLEILPRRLAAEIAARSATLAAAEPPSPHPASSSSLSSSDSSRLAPSAPQPASAMEPDPASSIALGPGLHLSTPVRAISRDGDGLVVETAGGAVLRAPRVILAVPAAAAAELLDRATGGASRGLAEIPYAPVAVIGLGFRRADVDHPLDGFGFLAARGGDVRILGCLFPSSLFPGRAPEGHVALTVFAGGRADPEPVEWPEERLVDLALADLGRALGVRGEPVARQVRRWPRAIPQYELGHGRFVELAARIERDLPGLTLAGNYLGGVSVPDRIARGAEAARGESAAVTGEPSTARAGRKEAG
jgi:oxygen-dependent protoporphyrinogen oxidase